MGFCCLLNIVCYRLYCCYRGAIVGIDFIIGIGFIDYFSPDRSGRTPDWHCWFYVLGLLFLNFFTTSSLLLHYSFTTPSLLFRYYSTFAQPSLNLRPTFAHPSLILRPHLLEGRRGRLVVRRGCLCTRSCQRGIHKKSVNSLDVVPATEALALPFTIETTTRSPRRYNKRGW